MPGKESIIASEILQKLESMRQITLRMKHIYARWDNPEEAPYREQQKKEISNDYKKLIALAKIIRDLDIKEESINKQVDKKVNKKLNSVIKLIGSEL
jgi:uncharacterized FlaG/YvyC family protein